MAIEGSLIDFGDEQPSPSFGVVNTSGESGKFEDNFWGQECRGFEVLLNNLKIGSSASHHLAEYIKERILLEKAYVKGLQKLSKSLGQVNDSTLGCFHPLWLLMHKTLDVVNSNKEKQVTALTELGKEINDYTSKLDEQLKGKMKGDIDSAHKSLALYRQSSELVRKSRKHYRASCNELAEHEKEVEKARQDPTRAVTKEMEKLEGRVKKGRVHVETCKTDYQKSISSHHSQWTEFEGKMVLACKKFQSLEEQHLTTLRDFLLKSATSHETTEMQLFKEYKKLKEHVEGLPVMKLISIFTNLKSTGTRKPELAQFTPIEIDTISKLPTSGSLGSISSMSKGSPHEVKKHRVKKEKKVKTNSKRPPSGATGSSKDGDTSSLPPPPPKDENVDEEGFTIRPKDADKITRFSDEGSHDSDSSDSDTDIETETEKRIHALTIKDQPTAPTQSNVDELSKVAKMLKLEAPLSSPYLKRAGSTQSLDTPPTSITSTDTTRQTSPIGSQSLFEQPIDHTPLPSPSPNNNNQFNQTAPPTLIGAKLPALPPPFTADWATFSPPPPLTQPTTQTTPTLPSLLPPPIDTSIGFGASFDNSNISSILPPPVSTTRSFIKSEPSSPMSTVKGLPPSSSLTPGATRSPRTISTGNITDSLQGSVSPLATTRRSATPTTSATLISSATPTDGKEGGVVIPLAVAFMETCNAIYKGSDLSKTVVKVSGQMDFSFPSNFISGLQSHPPLKFSLTNTQNISKILHNQNLMTQEGEGIYLFNMSKLHTHLKQLSDKSVSPFYNIQALKYEVNITKSSGLPLQLTSFWKCEPKATTMRLDYTYTPTVFPVQSKPSLTGLTINVTIGGVVTRAESQPKGAWSSDKNVMMWRLPDLSGIKDLDTQTLKCRFDLSSGPSSPTPALVQFVCDGSTLSGVGMSLSANQYKISLHKDKCISGKYMAEPVK